MPTIAPSAYSSTPAICSARRDADADARADPAVGRRVGVLAQASDEGAGRGIQLRALAGDAHRRDGVDEARRAAHDEFEPLVGRGRRREEDAVEARAGARGDPVLGGFGRDVGRDEARSPGREKVVGVAVDAVLRDGIPVRHDEHGHIDATGDLADRGEGVAHAEAAGESGLRRLLDDRAVHDGVGVGRAQLEDVGAVLGQRDGGLDARLQVGEAERQIADEDAAAFGARRVDRGGHTRGHSSTPSPLAASSAGGAATIDSSS